MTPLYKNKYPLLFKPLEIGKGKRKVVIKNRIISGPVGASEFTDPFGFKTEEFYRYFGAVAEGGFGAVNTQLHLPDIDSLGNKQGIENSIIANYHKLQRYLHAFDAVSIAEINHAEYHVIRDEKSVAVGPSDGFINGKPVKAITEQEMNEIADIYAHDAVIAVRSGFDIISIHFAHGFFMSTFLSPLTNRRTDEFGGSPENRCRFPIMVLKRIREAIGDEIPIEIRINGTDGEYIENGITVQECVEQAKIFSEIVDMINISAGTKSPLSRPFEHPNSFVKPGYNTAASAAVKEAVKNIPIGVVGGIHTPELAEQILEEGKADYIIMTRQVIADNQWVNKVREGREKDIRPCLRCNRCTGDINRDVLAENLIVLPLAKNNCRCSVNPLFCQGTEKRKLPLSPKKKKVAVIGGGVAGMQAAITAFHRGHEVILFEQKNQLGGKLAVFCGSMWFKKEIKSFIEYLKHQIAQTDIKVVLNTYVTPKAVEELEPDAVVVAIGAEPVVPQIRGIENNNVILGTDVFGKEHILGRKITIIGGGTVGCEIAIYLAEQNHDVTVVEQSENIAANAQLSERVSVLKHIEKNGIKTFTGTQVQEILDIGVKLKISDRTELLESDNIVICTGYMENKSVREAFSDVAFDVRFIGDCRYPGLIGEAVEAGFDAGATL